MDIRWLAHIDSHIAAGQVAAEAESAETLSWLLKLEPEQRWCLILNRDKRLERLAAADYRRLLSLMVELESNALAAAPQPPHPCLESLPLLTAPSVSSNPRAWRPNRLGVLLALAVILGGAWLFTQDGQQRLAALERDANDLLQSLEQERHLLDGIDDRITQEAQTTERLQRLMRARGALETLARQLNAGAPFADELAALERVWSAPEQLTPLKALATEGVSDPDRLRADLDALHQGLGARRAEAMQEARSGRLDLNGYYARMGVLSTLHAKGKTAVEAAHQDDWAGARRALEGVDEPDYQVWRKRVDDWLQTQTLLADLERQLALQWSEDGSPTHQGAAAP